MYIYICIYIYNYIYMCVYVCVYVCMCVRVFDYICHMSWNVWVCLLVCFGMSFSLHRLLKDFSRAKEECLVFYRMYWYDWYVLVFIHIGVPWHVLVYSSNILVCRGMSWYVLVCFGLFRCVLVCIWISWYVLVCFAFLYWYAGVCVGMYWYVLVCTCMYWYVMVCNGVQWYAMECNWWHLMVCSVMACDFILSLHACLRMCWYVMVRNVL